MKITKLKANLNVVHDKDLSKLLDKFFLTEKLHQKKLKCKFSGEIITFENLYCIFPESGDLKLVCNKPEAIKAFSEYLNEHGN